MDLSEIPSEQIPQIAAGSAAAREGRPFNPNESEAWRAGYQLRKSVAPPKPRLVAWELSASTRLLLRDERERAAKLAALRLVVGGQR